MTKPKEATADEIETIKKMRMVERLANMQLETQYAHLKKTGYNPFSNFKYFQLSDIEPWVTEICYKYRVGMTKSLTCNNAKLILKSWDDEEDIAETILEYPDYVKLDRMNLVQSAGSYVTFFTRYLYITTFNISEDDTIDALDNSSNNSGKNNISNNNSHKKSNKPISKPACYDKVVEKCKEEYPDKEVNNGLLNKVRMAMVKTKELTPQENEAMYHFIKGK